MCTINVMIWELENLVPFNAVVDLSNGFSLSWHYKKLVDFSYQSQILNCEYDMVLEN